MGCTGWSLPEWVGSFFKEKTKPGDFLTQYSSVFNTVEGNTSFYSNPSKEMMHQWAEKTPDGFKFCFKFPKTITHIKRLNNVEGEVHQFLEVFEDHREKLGPFMIQFPEAFSPQELPKLEKLLSILPKTMSYTVEVRNLDFFDKGRHEHSLNTLLSSYGVERTIFDTRKLHATKSSIPSILEAKLKKPKVPVRFEALSSRPTVRFVGVNDILNNEAYLKEWAIVVADWINEGRHPYIFIHSPDRISQPKLCTHFHKLLTELIGLPPLADWPVNREAQLGLF
ncbi:MAG: DUF72 domain-containing protein [Balneolaceae bacterium]